MVLPVILSITGTQTMPGQKPESIELTTQGSYSYEPGYCTLSYAESEMTGLEGTVTSFTVEDESTVTLRRTGKVNSKMVFVTGNKHDSLYDFGFGALLMRVRTTKVMALLNQKGGILDVEYELDIDGTLCGANTYHIEIRPNL